MITELDGKAQDPIDAWLAKTFPHQSVLCAEIVADLRRCSVLPIDPPNKSFLGNVVELAIGLDLRDQSPYLRLLNCLDHHRSAAAHHGRLPPHG